MAPNAWIATQRRTRRPGTAIVAAGTTQISAPANTPTDAPPRSSRRSSNRIDGSPVGGVSSPLPVGPSDGTVGSALSPGPADGPPAVDADADGELEPPRLAGGSDRDGPAAGPGDEAGSL
jgi:hypothetical protein